MIQVKKNRKNQITELWIKSHNLDSVDFTQFQHLETLDIRESTGSFYAISSLTGLKHLRLISNSLTDLGFLVNLNALKTLNLSINNITDISPLRNLISLRCLSLFNNRIVDISPLYDLQLSELNAAKNYIEQVDLDRFTFPDAPNEGQQENTPKLSFVDLTFNPIKSPNCAFLKSCAINTESEYFSDHIYGHVSSNLMGHTPQ